MSLWKERAARRKKLLLPGEFAFIWVVTRIDHHLFLSSLIGFSFSFSFSSIVNENGKELPFLSSEDPLVQSFDHKTPVYFSFKVQPYIYLIHLIIIQSIYLLSIIYGLISNYFLLHHSTLSVSRLPKLREESNGDWCLLFSTLYAIQKIGRIATNI